MTENNWENSQIDKINEFIDESKEMETKIPSLIEWLPKLGKQISNCINKN